MLAISLAVSVVTQSRGWPRSREEHGDAVPVRAGGVHEWHPVQSSMQNTVRMLYNTVVRVKAPGQLVVSPLHGIDYKVTKPNGSFCNRPFHAVLHRMQFEISMG